ncbi:DUF1153 domain-containing protein [Roseovarius amoyensis]|uniref:DUF1153 domain-containing protein n=1 Tax=Roseovarius amoyensis TaxID=2211448 RepID=UPI0023B866B1|nr:DUF1153 domain-containing protein [Roseovarius amoyensis]
MWAKTCDPGKEEKGESDVFEKVAGARAVKLPDGTMMTRADLPPRDTRRWVASRKLAVVRGVLHGLITRAEAEQRYGLSAEEFDEWLRAASSGDTDALKVTVRRPALKAAHKRLDSHWLSSLFIPAR